MFLLTKIDITSLLHSNVKDGIQFRAYTINNENVTHFRQFISVEVKKILEKSQAQFWEKITKLRLRQNNDFLIRNTCITIYNVSFLDFYKCNNH